MRYRRYITNRYKRYIYPAIINADNNGTLYNNTRIREDKEMYRYSVQPLFNEQPCMLSKNPDELYE